MVVRERPNIHVQPFYMLPLAKIKVTTLLLLISELEVHSSPSD